MHIHPYYQYLTVELFRLYGKENNPHNEVVRKLILRTTGLNNDTYYKLLGTVRKPKKLQPGYNNFRDATLDAIARLVKGCSDAHDFTRKYPIPTDLTSIEAAKCFWELSVEERNRIRNHINTMLQATPFEWATPSKPDEPQENLPILNGNYLLFYYNKESYSFRVAPLTISNGNYIKLSRYADLHLTGNIRVRGASVAATLASAKPTSKYFELLFAKPHPNIETIDMLTVTIMYARTYKLSARHGVGLCVPISADKLANFVFRDDNFTEQQLHTLPIQLTAQQIGLLYDFPVITFDFVESKQSLKKFSKHHHDGCFHFYFCRNESEKAIHKLPVLIKNGVVHMKHPRIDQNYIGKWTFKNPVLWIYMETIDDGKNYVDEDFVMQIKIDGLTLSEKAISRFHGVYTTTRSYGALPIVGNLILERAEFDYDQATGEVIDLDSTSDAELHRLKVWYQGQQEGARVVK